MRRTIGLIVLGVLLAGCTGKNPLPKTVPVKGKVVDARGLPVQGGSIRFEPKKAADLTISSEIGSDGSFDLKTFRNKEQVNGVEPGEYTVVIQRPITEGNQPPPPVTLAETVKVPEGGLSDLQLKLPAK
jgi:hypothetical protein